MQKAKTKKAAKVKRVPRLIGRDSKQGKQIKKSATGHRILRNGTNDSTGKHLVPFALKPITKELPLLEVAIMQGGEHKYGDEAVQLKMIADLFPVISSLKGYNKFGEIKSDSKPSKVLTNLIIKFEACKVKFEKWTIEKEKEQYVIKALNVLDAESACFIPVDFLSQINQSHPKLHEFLIYAFRLVKQCNGLGMISDWVKFNNDDRSDGMYYSQLTEREEWDDSNYDEEEADGEEDDFHYSVKHSLEYYGPRGVVASYSKLLSGGASLRMFKKQLAEFKPSNEFEEYALPFLQATLALAETKQSIYDYCKEPWESGEATPAQYLQVVWTVDEDDNMYQIFSECLDASASGCGVVGFCWEVTLKNNYDSSIEKDLAYIKKVDNFYQLGREMAHNIKDKLKGVGQYPPQQFKKSKNGRLVDILV